MTELFPAGVTTLLPFIVLAVLGLVEVTKSFGATGRVLTLVSLVIGAAYGLVIFLLPVDTLRIVIAVSLFGLAASGLYDFGGIIGKSIAKVK